MLSDWRSVISSHSVGHLQALVEIRHDTTEFSTRLLDDGFRRSESGSLHAWIFLPVSVSVYVFTISIESVWVRSTMEGHHRVRAMLASALPHPAALFRRILETRPPLRVATDGSDRQWRERGVYRSIFNQRPPQRGWFLCMSDIEAGKQGIGELSYQQAKDKPATM